MKREPISIGRGVAGAITGLLGGGALQSVFGMEGSSVGPVSGAIAGLIVATLHRRIGWAIIWAFMVRWLAGFVAGLSAVLLGLHALMPILAKIGFMVGTIAGFAAGFVVTKPRTVRLSLQRPRKGESSGEKAQTLSVATDLPLQPINDSENRDSGV